MLLSRQNIEAEHAKKLAELYRQETIAAKLPYPDILVPDFIHQFRTDNNVAYDLEKEPGSMETAVDMVDLFGELHPIEYRRGTFSCLGPVGKYDDSDGKLVYEVEDGIELIQTAGKDYSQQELKFYPVASGCEVTIRFKLPYQLQTRIACDYGRGGQVLRGSRRMVNHRLAMRELNYSGWEEGRMRHVSIFEGRDELRRNLLLED